MGIFRREPNPLAPNVLPFSAHRAMTAAATKVNVTDKRQLEIIQKRKASASWQSDAWEYYDLVGEIKYAFRLFSNVLSRIRLYAGYVTDDDEAPTPLAEIDDELIDYRIKKIADAAMRRVFSGGRQAEILRKAAANLLVAGECYLVQLPPRVGVRDREQWRVLSVNELVLRNGMYFYKSSKTQRDADLEQIPSSSFVGRVWVEHPDYSDEADSSMRAIVELCDEMFLFSRAARATARSRLNAGALFVPDTLSVSADQVTSEQDTVDVDGNPIIPEADDDDDEFERELLDAMTTPISDESSAASVVPLLIRGPAEAGDKIKFIKFERSFDPQLAIRAERALERILQAIDLPKDIVTGLANIKYCLDPETYTLSRSGWKAYTELEVGEDILTLNHETGLSEWQPLEAINTFDCVDEPMLSIETRDHSSLSTLNHRWPVLRDSTVKTRGGSKYDSRRSGLAGAKIESVRSLSGKDVVTHRTWTTSGEVANNSGAKVDFVVTGAPCADVPTEAKYTDDFVELIAWLYTEGSISKKTSYSSRFSTERAQSWKRRNGFIAQCAVANEQHFTRIKTLLTRMFGKQTLVLESRSDIVKRGRERSSHGGTPEWRILSNKKSGNGLGFAINEEVIALTDHVFIDEQKTPSRDFIYSLTRAQLELFVQVPAWADGCGDKTAAGHIFGQKHEPRLEAFELACHLLGITVHRHKTPSHWYSTGVQSRTKTRLSPDPRNDGHALVPYTGVVWCPTTANQTWFVRRHGKTYFTGNSNALQVEDQMYKQHIEPMILMICDALRAVYLEPALLAAGVDPEVAERIVIWYDPTAIQTAPDKSSAANVGFDKFALSFDAWRRANGFVDSDAPSSEEMGQRIAITRGTLNDTLTEALFRTMFPDILDAARQQSLANSPSPLPPDAQQMLGDPATQQPPSDPSAQQPPQAPGAPTPQANPNEPVLQPPTA